MEKGTSFGRKQQEEVWQNVEVDALYRSAAPACVSRSPTITSRVCC